MKLVILVLALIGWHSTCLADPGPIRVNGPGTYRLDGRTHDGKSLKSVVRVAATPSDWQKDGLQDARTVITDFSVEVDRSPLFVGRSAYADLMNPTQISLTVATGSTRIVVRGGDAADSYRAVMRVGNGLISSREVFTPLIPGKPTERTTYWIRELRDR